jgi:hypothetical protein
MVQKVCCGALVDGEALDSSSTTRQRAESHAPPRADEEEEKEGEEVGDANEPAVIMALCNPCPVCMKEYTFKKLTQHPTAT